MIYCDFINIDEAHVHGIVNPTFMVKGSVHRDDYEFKVVVDGVEVSFQTLPNLVYRGFCINLNIPKKSKDIKVYVISEGEEILIVERKNSLAKRIKSKIRTKTSPTRNKIDRRINKLKKVLKVTNEMISMIWEECHFLIRKDKWEYYKTKYKNKVKFALKSNGIYNVYNQEEYLYWLSIHDELESVKDIEKFSYNPKISIVIPVYNVGKKYLSECIDSILQQTYQNFEICLADDNSKDIETINTLKEYEQRDKRVKVVYRSENGHISKATNDAISMASGEFIGLMDNDDLLAKNALYEVVKVLNDNKYIDMIYTDEDKMDLNGERRDPHFKPDFSPDSLLSSNYICHFTVLRKSIVEKIGGFRVGYEGSQDHDLFLRFTEQTDNIYHICKVLYHWRMIPGSTAESIDSKNYAVERGRQSVEDALHRRGINANVTVHPEIPYYMIEYLYNKEPKISIIIPTKDHAQITRECLSSIFEKTSYQNYEVILMNNRSDEKETLDLFEEFKKKYSNFKVKDANFEFNYSKINNIAVEDCDSDYILLLNNDTKVITENWLQIMVGYAMQKHIGTVGCKLLYPDDTVQHGGMVIGAGGIANHAMIGEARNSYGIYARLAIPYNYSGNTAACLMVSRKIYKSVGGLDETLKVAFNDVDFNLKVVQAGYYNIFLPQVELYHFESKSRGLDTTTEKYKRFIDEQYYMHKKWKKELQYDPMYNKNFSLIKCFALDEMRIKL